jgi:hypothetical protein
MQKALERIHRDWPAFMQQANIRHHFILCRVAVVDRIPFPDGSSSGCPGISLAVTPWNGNLLSKSRLQMMLAGGKPEEEVSKISVKIPFQDNHGNWKAFRVQLQAANTLFVNGLRSTMFLEKWVLDNTAVGFPKFLRQDARQYVDRLTMTHTSLNSSLAVPLERLTARKEISMCMGNIISKLVGTSDSEPTSASLELEEQVPAFIKSKNATNGNLSVFALIIPRVRPQTESLERLAMPLELLGHHGSVRPEDLSYVKQQTLDHIRLAISNGAHLHRVTSGGGGWGKKQGLLSLEPALSFDSEEPDVPPLQVSEGCEGKLEESGPMWSQHSPQIASPGDSIEFFGHFSSKEEEEALTRKESLLTGLKKPDTSQWSSRDWSEGDMSRFVWGVLPPQDSNGASTTPILGDKLITFPHQFGMLSEAGMVLQRMDYEIDKQAHPKYAAVGEREINMTKIDVPHTVLAYSVPSQKAIQTTPVAETRLAGVEPAETQNTKSGKREQLQRAPRFFNRRLRLEDLDYAQGESEGHQQEAESSHLGKTGFAGIPRAASSDGSTRPHKSHEERARNSATPLEKYGGPLLVLKRKSS